MYLLEEREKRRKEDEALLTEALLGDAEEAAAVDADAAGGAHSGEGARRG